MSLRLVLAMIGLATVAAAWAADTLMIRPGRWEVLMQMDFGDRKLPAGMPLDQAMKKIDCITQQDLEQFDGFLEPPDESCKVSNYRSTGKELAYLMKCDGMTMDFKATVHSPDSFSAVSTSHGRDPGQQMVMKLSAKRVGDACTAKEMAEAAQD
jgi:Protein of unknown function (DUF3617)